LEVSWAFAGEQERRSVGKFLPPKVDQFVSRLRAGGWYVAAKDIGVGTFNIAAQANVHNLKSEFDRVADALRDATSSLKF
jgi:hypothetical protein